MKEWITCLSAKWVSKHVFQKKESTGISLEKTNHRPFEVKKKQTPKMEMLRFQRLPGTQMTSIFEGQPPKTRPKFQSKQGSFGFQVRTEFVGGLAIF